MEGPRECPEALLWGDCVKDYACECECGELERAVAEIERLSALVQEYAKENRDFVQKNERLRQKIVFLEVRLDEARLKYNLALGEVL